ncbi:putative polysaccharide biosynthesis protein [Alkalihalobacillus pseudalcaliphilus]|uniref:putative polysaccharide biosynthesis protein n=1 Tax=Alkalihalobacillus pseudalcaliphilus TaxID=79884 RepID=UPI00069F51D2|nr:polysaccharide biosynthesis protein [Alkalihalobacillus pseudalcaliphilus]
MKVEDAQSQEESFLKGAILLSMAAIIAKLLSAAYRIPYQNLAGDLGFYVYQQIYPFYGLVVTLAMYGFPVVISRQMTEYRSRGQEEKGKQFLAISLFSLSLFSVCTTLFMFFGAPWLAQLMGDSHLTEPIRAISFVFLLLPLISVGRGITQSEQNMVPTALSQVSEQFIRVIGILLFAFLLIQLGYGPYGAGIGAAFGSLAGSFVAGIILLLSIRKVKVRTYFTAKRMTSYQFFSYTFRFFKQSLFICMGALTFIWFQFVDVFSMIPLLNQYGLSSNEAFYIKALYDRGQPILQMGTIITTTFALALVPLLTNARMLKEHSRVRFYQGLTWRLTILIAGAATIGLWVIIEPLNAMLFMDRAGSEVIKIYMLSVFVGAIYMTGAAILQGHGYVHIPAIAVFVGVGAKLSFNLLLIPIYGSSGAAWSTVLALVVMACSVLYGIYKLNNGFLGRLRPYRWLFLSLVTMLVATSVWQSFLSTKLEPTRIHDTILTLTTVTIGIITMVLMIWILPIFNAKEWSAIPVLNKWNVKNKK